MPAVLALKEAVVELAGTVIEDGAVRAGLVLASVTTAPPEGAGWDRMTVQAPAAFGPRIVGLHDSEETRTDVARVMVVFAELPLLAAVTVAVEVPLKAVVVALNVAEVAEAATVTEAGTVSPELVFDRLMLTPPAGAAWDRVTVQVLEAFGPSVLGVQDSEVTDTGATNVSVLLADLPL